MRKTKKDTVVLIYCAGEGTRLRPLTYKIPKPLLPISNNVSLLDLHLQRLIQEEFRNVIINYSYKKALFVKLIEKYTNKLHIELIKEKKPLGHGGTLLNNKSLIQKHTCVLGLNGDTYIDTDLTAFIKKTPEDVMSLMVKNECTNLSKVLNFSKAKELIALKGPTKVLFYTNKIAKKTSTVWQCHLGTFLLPTKMLNKIKYAQKDTFMGMFGENDLIHQLIKQSTRVVGIDGCAISKFFTMNTLDEYSKLKKQMQEFKTCQ